MLNHMLETKSVADKHEIVVRELSKMSVTSCHFHSLIKTLNLLSCRKLCSQSFYVDQWDFLRFLDFEKLL